ncbi:Phosphoadenylyl-sulfate reductase [thioredoxin] [hydrothermal vent metagenome]|uniref:Phosphoadenylyl-sulfate reductase [thioredoxin] n=1 Tax=hydrothermal vent metagenome TaxID=652676 RepID=A0A3B1DNS9_9ZZZZ
MAKLTQADLTKRNKDLENRTPQQLITWAKEVFGNRLTGLSSMQRAGSVLCHMLSQMDTNISVLFVDTGVLFSETLQTRDRFIEEYGLEIITLSPQKTMEEQTEEHGVLYLSPEGQAKCCEMRKTEPLLAIAENYDAMMSSLRRSDGGQRSSTPLLSIDERMNCIRINPLVNFNDEQMTSYLTEHNVIINPLHAQGFSTIGCDRCTTPVMPNEPKRAGRWRHLGPWSMYCGINPTDVETATPASIDLPIDLIDRVLGRETDYMI